MHALGDGSSGPSGFGLFGVLVRNWLGRDRWSQAGAHLRQNSSNMNEPSQTHHLLFKLLHRLMTSGESEEFKVQSDSE